MATQFDEVQTGDLITAKFMNDIVAEIQLLQTKVAVLEASAIGSTAVTIYGLIPPSGEVKVGGELQAIGKNFGYSSGALRVDIDRTHRVFTFKDGSSDERLIFDIPTTIIDVPAAGRAATLTISNANSSAYRTLQLQTPLQLSGGIDVVPNDPQPTTPEEGKPYTFEFAMHSRASLDATWTIKPVIDVTFKLEEWTKNLRVLGANGAEIPSRQIPLQQGKDTKFYVKIDPIPTGTASIPFTLTVDAQAGSVSGTSGPLPRIVGIASTPPDTTIKAFVYDYGEIKPTGAAGTVDEATIRLPKASSAKVHCLARFSVVGKYDIAAKPKSGNWNAKVSEPVDAVIEVKENELQNQDGQTAKTLVITVWPAENAPSSKGSLEFTLKRQGQDKTRTMTMAFELMGV